MEPSTKHEREFPFWLPTASHDTPIEGFQRTFFFGWVRELATRSRLPQPFGRLRAVLRQAQDPERSRGMSEVERRESRSC